MKIYIDLKNQTILTQKNIYGKPFYIGSEYTDTIEVYFNEQPKNWNPTITYKLANGRTVGPVYPDGGPTPLADEDGSWYYYEFVVSTENGVLAVAGQLTITINVNYTNDVGLTIKRATIGNVINQVVMTANYGNEKNIVIYGDDDINQLLFDYKNEMEKLGNNVTSISNKYNTFDLGELQQDPFSTNNTVLNAITSIGLYKFTYNNQSYLMLVDDGTAITQTVIYYGGVGFIQFFHRILTATTCSVSSKKTLALSDKVAMDIYNAKEEVYENVYKKPQTYSRDEALAIGLIEVSEYNAKTGEITVTYNPNTVDVTYDEDTGELIFSQKTYLLDSNALPNKIRTLKLGLSEAEINNIKNSVTEDIDTLRNQLSNGAFRVKYAGTADVAKTAETAGLTMKREPIASKEDLKAYDEAKNIVSAIKKYVNADGSLKAKYDGNGNQIDTTYATQKMITDLIGGAPESYNTLKEIADYIKQDKSGASSMLSSIQNNASNIIKNSNDIDNLYQKIADVESNIAKEIAEALAGEY